MPDEFDLPQVSDSGTDHPGAESVKTRPPKSVRLQEKQEKLLQAFDMQNSQISQLTDAVGKLLAAQAANQTQAARKESGTLDSFSNADLKAIINNDDADPAIKNEALVALVNRNVEEKMSGLRDQVRQEFQTGLSAQQQTNQVRASLANLYGSDINDPSTALGRRKAEHYQQWLKMRGDEVKTKPEYEFMAAWSAAQELGVGPDSGSSERGDTSPGVTRQSQPQQPPSKSGPPPEAITDTPEGFAERISKGKVALSQKDNKGFIKDSVIGTLFPEWRGR